MKSHPVPHAGVPFQPVLNHKCTVPAPFTFEERDKLTLARKQEKIEEIYEEERKVVHLYCMYTQCLHILLVSSTLHYKFNFDFIHTIHIYSCMHIVFMLDNL